MSLLNIVYLAIGTVVSVFYAIRAVWMTNAAYSHHKKRLMAVRTPLFRLTIVNRSGAVVRDVNMTTVPDGVSFHVNPTFVVTNNNDGSISRFDFPSNDFSAAPVQSVLAAGGFRGDLSQVGADACLYATQNGTRFNNGVVSLDNSVVRICPNFVPPPGVNPALGRMTGGGSVFTTAGVRVTHGFELHCNIKNTPNNLEVNWYAGNRFHLEILRTAVCFTDQAISATPSITSLSSYGARTRPPQ